VSVAASSRSARHLELFVEHPCCYIVPGAEDVVQCGLWCGHDGAHLPYVPGAYLWLAPELHPLDALRLRLARWPWRMLCPVCAGTASSWEAKQAGLTVWILGGEQRAGYPTEWRFGPCGCEAREVRW
jgi:hypothetical protein